MEHPVKRLVERAIVKAYKTVLSLLVGAIASGACAKIDTPATGSGGSGGPKSGSGGRTGAGGSGGVPGRGGAGGGLIMSRDGGTGECGQENFDLERKPAIVMLVLDRSASMVDNLMDEEPAAGEPTKWSQLIPALVTTIPSVGGDISWGMKTFPEGGTGNGTACLAASVTTKIDLPVASMNAAALVTAINAVQPMGDGTPTSTAITVATDYLKTLPGDSKKYILLATDGQPSCYGTIGNLT